MTWLNSERTHKTNKVYTLKLNVCQMYEKKYNVKIMVNIQ